MQNLNISQILRKKDYHRPLIFNGVLWFLAFLIFLFIFSKGQSPILIDYIYTLAYILLLAIPVSINFYLLIPRLLKKEQYVVYVVLLISNCIVFSLFSEHGLRVILNFVLPDFYFISYPTRLDHLIIYSITIFSTTLIKLAEDWFSFNTKQNQLLRLEKSQVQGQLIALRSQINPHFLFNSLNVIYSLALEKSENTTKSILQLSDILRYVIYDSNVERVDLGQEIDMIKNYIEFQKQRHHLKDVIRLDISVENPEFKIYPMLLLPFIENSFKHGAVHKSNENNSIAMKLIQKNNLFEFQIRNKFEQKQHQDSLEPSGIGIENIKNNLLLVYPKNHELIINDQNNLFEVSLKIYS